MSDRANMVGDGRLLDTLDMKSDEYSYYSSSSFDRHRYFHSYHPYVRSDMG